MSRGSSLIAPVARLVLLAASFGCVGAAAVTFLSGRLADMSGWGTASVLAVILGAALAMAVVGIRLSPRGVVRVAAELIFFGMALLSAEVIIRMIAPEIVSTQLERKLDADKLGLPFDLRTKSEVVADLRSRGDDALPGISREWPRLPSVRQQLPEGLFPLSHASNVDVVECNESGRYLVFHTDELGFNNPPGLITGGKIDAAAVGASFTLGHCVADGQSLVTWLRRSYPKLANFGIAGSGTLSILASFREYVEPLEPPLVLWIMHPWTADTRDELADPILSRYLDPGFSQHLLARRQEIDQTWRSIAIPVQYELDHRAGIAVQNAARDRFGGVLTLSALRRRLHLNDLLAKPPLPPDLGPFQRSIALAQRTTQSWGGRFVVIIMPLYAEVVTHDLAEPLHHERLAALLRGMGVEVIDTVPVFQSLPDPTAVYVMRRNNHPTAHGHEMLAQFVVGQLHIDGKPASVAANRGRDNE